MRSLMSPLIIGSITLLSVSAGQAQQPSQTTSERIGTFDSRAIAVAFYNSAEFQERVFHFGRELEEAKASGDEERVKQIEAYKPTFEQIMQQQTFNTGSVSEIMEKIKEELPQIAENAGVSVIVSKWEVAYKSPAVELVDLTLQLVALFDPERRTLQWIKSLMLQDPTPLELMPPSDIEPPPL